MTEEERKEALKAAHRRHYEKHKAEILEQHKQYMAEHREKILEQRRAYYDLHREEILAKNKAYKLAHPEKRKKYNSNNAKGWYQAHREEILAKKHEKYRAEHPEKPQTKRKNIVTRPRAMTAEERRSHACDVTRKSYRLKRGIPLDAPVNYRTPHYDIPEVTEPDWLAMMTEQWGPDGFRELPADILSDIPERAHTEYLRRMWLNVDGPATAKYFAYKGAWAPWMEQFGYPAHSEVTEE